MCVLGPCNPCVCPCAAPVIVEKPVLPAISADLNPELILKQNQEYREKKRKKGTHGCMWSLAAVWATFIYIYSGGSRI